MPFDTTAIAEALRVARFNKGLSQRALSTLSGVPQAHISKIEQGAVDLRLSSLMALAHALDLELALVLKKAVPAVKSIARATAAMTPPAAQKEFARLLQAAQRARHAHPLPDMERLATEIESAARMAWAATELPALREMRKAVEALAQSAEPAAVQHALKRFRSIRNAVAHNVPHEPAEAPRPAYTLEDDDA